MRKPYLFLLITSTLLWLGASCTTGALTPTQDLVTRPGKTTVPGSTAKQPEENNLYLPVLIQPEDATPVPEPSPEKAITPANQEYPAPEIETPMTEDPTAIPQADDRLPPENWQEWPVIPEVSERAKEIYRDGLAMGNNPNAYSKVGDCQNIHQYFMGIFDDPNEYRLGEQYAYLKPAIDHFHGSYDRVSMAVRTGFNVASVLASFNADQQYCQANETPLECELRIWRPAIVIISMETWDESRPTDAYEGYLRKIVDITIEHGAVPIVATKADNLEGDHAINAAIARVAYDYDIPLWNFWLEVQPLPDHGLMEDAFHLTIASNFFDDPNTMQAAWPHRNLSALQVLNAVWRSVSGID